MMEKEKTGMELVLGEEVVEVLHEVTINKKKRSYDWCLSFIFYLTVMLHSSALLDFTPKMAVSETYGKITANCKNY